MPAPGDAGVAPAGKTCLYCGHPNPATAEECEIDNRGAPLA